MYSRYILFLFLIPTLLLSKSYRFSSGTDVADADEAPSTIETLFEKKDYDKACKLVDELYKNSPYNVQANLYYGRCAYYRGDIDTAMAAYDRAEILDEEDAEVHKHLGDLHAHIGNIEIANSEYDKADRFGKDKVERALDSAYSSNTFSLLGRFSGGYDSNVNYNAELSEMQKVDPSASDKPTSDSFTKEYIRLTHIYDSDALNSFYYKSRLHGYNKNYSDLSEDDFAQVGIYTGPGWASKDFDLWVPMSYTYAATDYESYTRSYSLNPQLRKRFENKVLLRVEGEYQHQAYLQWDEGDKDIYSADLSLSRWFDSNYFRVAYRYLKAKKDNSNSPRVFIDKYFNEAEVNYTYVFSKSIELGAGYLFNKTLYSDSAGKYDSSKREDALQKLSAYISYNITKSVGISLQYENYVNDTNFTPSNYTKEVVTGGVYFYY